MILHDKQKNEFCIQNNITLYRIPYWDFEKIETIDDILNPCYLINTGGTV